MRKLGFRVLSVFCRTGFLLLFLAPSAEAKIRYLLDFDGTLVDDHGEKAGWVTPWLLKRIELKHASLQPNPSGSDGGKTQNPPLVEITYQEYRRLLPYLGKAEAMLGDLQPQMLDKDPIDPDRVLEIIPGFYRVSHDVSFAQYRPGMNGQNYMLLNYRAAKKREEASRNRLNWRGRAFPLLQAALSDADTVGDLILSSARGNTDEEFQALLKEWQKDGEVAYAVQKSRGQEAVRPRTHFLHDPESILFGHALAEKKAKVVSEEATQLLNGPFEAHDELATDEFQAKEGITAKMHALIVAEDDPRYVAAISKTLETLSSDLHYGNQIKFVLFNAGSDSEVSETRWPWRWTVYDKGFGREALPAEIAVWAKIKSQKSCEALLRGESVKRRRS